MDKQDAQRLIQKELPKLGRLVLHVNRYKAEADALVTLVKTLQLDLADAVAEPTAFLWSAHYQSKAKHFAMNAAALEGLHDLEAAVNRLVRTSAKIQGTIEYLTRLGAECDFDLLPYIQQGLLTAKFAELFVPELPTSVPNKPVTCEPEATFRLITSAFMVAVYTAGFLDPVRPKTFDELMNLLEDVTITKLGRPVSMGAESKRVREELLKIYPRIRDTHRACIVITQAGLRRDVAMLGKEDMAATILRWLNT
ncbi:MAG TPA: hypothetical protein VNG90_03885 [Candidatus Acidoferrum sp.]|nr:hypothetical protein [Candidatus Acidoferrum sp.]